LTGLRLGEFENAIAFLPAETVPELSTLALLGLGVALAG
jgi:hypothetical protein